MNGALWLLPLFAVGYALWAFFRLRRMERNEPADGIVSEDTPCRQEIIGRSRFVLDPRHSRPQAAVESETEKVTEKADIFVPTNVPEHPRQIPPEDLDEVFGVAPEGEPNEPLEIDFPLYDESFPDADAEEPDYDEDEDDTEELPLLGRSLAQGVSFEQNWAKPTATWYTIHLQQTSKGRKRDVSPGPETDRHVRGHRFGPPRRERQGKIPDRHLPLGFSPAYVREVCGKPISAGFGSHGFRRP